MARIMCFDYGSKRIGIAVTDELKIIATPLSTCLSHEIFNFIDSYIVNYPIEKFVIGMPVDLKGNDTDATKFTKDFIKGLKNKYSNIPTETYDERYTSRIAKDAILLMGKNKKYRRTKSNVDKISASIILQSYLKRNQL